MPRACWCWGRREVGCRAAMPRRAAVRFVMRRAAGAAVRLDSELPARRGGAPVGLHQQRRLGSSCVDAARLAS